MIYAQVDDRVRKQSGLEINDVIQSIGDESVEGLTFATTTEMIQHCERDFQTLKLKVSRIMCKVEFDDSSDAQDVPRSQLAAATPRDALAALGVRVDMTSDSAFLQLLLKVARAARPVKDQKRISVDWLPSELILAASLGVDFRNGMLPLEAGSLRNEFLGELLNRPPTAINNKFKAEKMKLGKQAFEQCQDVHQTDLEKALRTRRDQVEAFVASQLDPQAVSPRGRPSSPRPATELPVVNTARTGYQNSSTPIKHQDLPPLNTIPKQGKPSYDSVINFARRTSAEKQGGTTNWCVMCGQKEGTGDGCVRIPSLNKDVCRACDSTFWKHNASGVYFKWCKGKKNFQEIHAFADNLTAAKCDEARSRSSSPRAVPAPAAPPPTTPAPVLAEPPPLLPAGVVQPPANIERPVAAPAAAAAPHDDPMEEDD